MWYYGQMAVNALQNTETLPAKDAVIVRGANGQFLPGTRAPKTITSSADARSMAEKRWEKARKATASRVMQEAQSIDPTVQTEYDAHALMMAKQYTTIIDSDKPRMDDAEKLAQAMGTMPRNVELRQEQPQHRPSDDVSQALLLLVQLLDRDNRVIVEGKVSE